MIAVLLTAILLGLLLALAILMRHRRQLRAIMERLDRVPVSNEEMLKDVVKRENDATRHVVKHENDATRLHVSQAVDGIKHDTEMTKIRVADYIDREQIDASETNRSMITLSGRIHLLTQAVDALGKRVLAIPGQIAQWFQSLPKDPK